MFFYCYISNRKTPKYKTPAFVKNPRSVQEQNVHEKKRLSFNCHEESNDTRAKQSQAVSPGQGENIEENLRECLKQLEEVRQKGIFSFVTNNNDMEALYLRISGTELDLACTSCDVKIYVDLV